MSKRSEIMKELSSKIRADCREMQDVLSKFPIKVVKSYRRYNFSPDNTMKVRGKDMKIPEIISYIQIVYSKAKALASYSHWRTTISTCDALYKRGKSGINYAEETYNDFKKTIKMEFYTPMKEITQLSNEIAKSIKNFSINESEVITNMSRLTREQYDAVKTEIEEQLDCHIITESEARDMVLVLEKENEEHFTDIVQEDLDALGMLYERGIIDEEAFNDGVGKVRMMYETVNDVEISYDTPEDEAIYEEQEKIQDLSDEIEKRLYIECADGVITEEEREATIRRLRELRNSAASLEEFEESVSGEQNTTPPPVI